ncbi:uncharacterized protein LOC126586206 isoform X2 [Malus sylvestris]|uniref:uncharacterized protein LOC126586206 isoform X2 n=1 Tax=Malus sylvestris TaxID=3752 RepID=UPI0021ABCF0E|nr:uncharacterized protein LOC126586206 isoform X2 [Malus sylvestris]
MDFPRFHEGDDMLGWIYKAEHYFNFFNIDDAKKVKLASFHMEGESIQWFQWARCLTNYPSWEEFANILCQEFGPSEMEDSAESLVKLRQTGTLRDYVLEFRRLINRTKDISPRLLRSCFIGGLKPELRYDVKLLKPKMYLKLLLMLKWMQRSQSLREDATWENYQELKLKFPEIVIL